MNRQEQLDRRYYDTGLEDMGIGFKHEPLTPAAALGTARGIIREMEEPQPQDVLTCEDYDPDQYEPLTLITVEQGGHMRTLERIHAIKEGNNA